MTHLMEPVIVLVVTVICDSTGWLQCHLH